MSNSQRLTDEFTTLRTLLPSQKNEVLALVQNADLDPARFEWSVVPSKLDEEVGVSKLVYIGSPFFYQFDFSEEDGFGYYAIFSPAETLPIEEGMVNGGWKEQKGIVANWLSYLRREVGQPDLWGEISRFRFPISSELTVAVANEAFSENEVEEIVVSLNQVRHYLSEQQCTSEEQNRLMNEKLDYLIDAAKRERKRDWMYTCVGVVLQLTTVLAVDAALRKTLWVTIWGIMIKAIEWLPK